MNNIIGAHEAFTVTYAGTFQLEELQYLAASYRQVLTSEGLTGFINASYGFGRPGADAVARARLPDALGHRRGGPRLSGDPHARGEPVS